MASVRARAERLVDAAAELMVGLIAFLLVDAILPTWLAIVAGVAALVAESKRHDRERAARQRRLLRPELVLVLSVALGAVVLLLAMSPASVEAIQ